MFEGLFQPMRLLIIAGLVLLIFGPNELPELGEGIHNFVHVFSFFC